MKSAPILKIVAVFLMTGLLASCAAASEGDQRFAPIELRSSPAAGESLPALAVCAVPDPQDPGSAFEIERGSAADLAAQWVSYACKQRCEQWRQCAIDAADGRGEPLRSGRGMAKRALAFVVDGMGGHLAFTPDGDKTVLFQYGGGGNRYHQESANRLEENSTARTVMVRWEPGYKGFVFPLGWFTRNSPQPSDVRQQSRRIAAVARWVHDHLSRGHAFGTAGDSMGSAATLGAVVWHGLDSIIDYQLLVGGPPMWDVNAGCGRVRYEQGYCDQDGVTSCRDDGDCRGKGSCRRPAKLPTHSFIWEGIINYLYVSDACRPLAEGAADDPHPAFESSSMRTSGVDWQIDHPVDFMVDLGGVPGQRARGGDEYWALGQFPFVYNKIDSAGHRSSWIVSHGTHHSQSIDSDEAVAAIKKGLGL